MRFEIIGKNIKVTEAMKKKIESKLAILDKYLIIDPNTIARVVARVYPNSQKVEVTIPTKIGLLRTEVVDDDFYAAVDLAIDKLEGQIRKQKTRLSRRHRDNLAQSFVNEAEEEETKEEIPVRTKTITADVLDLDEAIMQMELSNHDFYIYTDVESGKTSVVYRRKSGSYGLIEVDR